MAHTNITLLEIDLRIRTFSSLVWELNQQIESPELTIISRFRLPSLLVVISPSSLVELMIRTVQSRLPSIDRVDVTIVTSRALCRHC